MLVPTRLISELNEPQRVQVQNIAKRLGAQRATKLQYGNGFCLLVATRPHHTEWALEGEDLESVLAFLMHEPVRRMDNRHIHDLTW